MFIDFSKAFDLVNHVRVLGKLQNAGIHPILTQWFHSFLAGRKQRVRVGDQLSDWDTTNGGMPQGTWNGARIFIHYEHDCQPNCWCHKYVDDTTLSETFKNPEESNLQKEADYMCEWCNTNSMRVNSKKTKEMRINFRKPMDLTPITINGEPIEQVKASKMLGVILAEDLGWEEHINQITSKASQRLHFLTILKRAGLRQADLNTYYCAVIRPVLEYAVPVWHPGLTKAHTSSIERIQK
jgi:hypothetical protein